jgi:hypothetical protein
MLCSWGAAHPTSDCSGFGRELYTRQHTILQKECAWDTYLKNKKHSEIALNHLWPTELDLNKWRSRPQQSSGYSPVQRLASCQKLQHDNTKAINITLHCVNTRHGRLWGTVPKWSQHVWWYLHPPITTKSPQYPHTNHLTQLHLNNWHLSNEEGPFHMVLS